MSQVNMKDLVKANDIGSKTYRVLEVLAPKAGDGAPTMNAEFFGQIYVDETAKVGYMAIEVGNATPANDWKQVTNV